MDCSSEEQPAVKQELGLSEDDDGAPIFPANQFNNKATSVDGGGGMVKIGAFGNIRKLMHGLSSRDDSFLDLDLICAEGKVLRCHKFIIGAQSTYLRQLMLSVENDGLNGEDGNRCRMNFPDIEVDHMEVILKFLYTGKLYITWDIKEVIRELLEDILQIDADIQFPDIPEKTSSNKRNGINDNDGGDDGDGGSSSGSPPPNKQPKQEEGDGSEASGGNDNSENDGTNGFSSEEGSEFRQHSTETGSYTSKQKKTFVSNDPSNFHLPPSPPHDIVFDDDDDDDEFDKIPLPLLEPETQLEDGPATSEFMELIENGEDSIHKDFDSSKAPFRLHLSSVKDNLKNSTKSTKIAPMKFDKSTKGKLNASELPETEKLVEENSFDEVHIKTEVDPDLYFPEIESSPLNQNKAVKCTQKSNKKGKGKQGVDEKSSRKGGLLTGNDHEPLSATEFEVKQELLDMQDPKVLPVDERQIKQEQLEEEMRQAFDYYGKNANTSRAAAQNFNLPLPPNLPLPFNYHSPFGGLGMFGFNQALFNGHQMLPPPQNNVFLPPPVPMPPAPGMVIKAGKWVDPSKLRQTPPKETNVSTQRRFIHKHHFTPHTITGKVFDRTLETLAEPDGEHPCSFCGNIYNKRASLESHIKRNHNPNLTVKCPECPKLLSCHAAIKKHLLTHRPESEWPYICEFCGKRFQAKGDLPKHFVTTQHRDDPKVPKPGTLEWQIVLDRSAVVNSSFLPNGGTRGKKRKRRNYQGGNVGDLELDIKLETHLNVMQEPNLLAKLSGDLNKLGNDSMAAVAPDLPNVKEEPDNDTDISHLYPEISLNSSHVANNLPKNKNSKKKKSSVNGNVNTSSGSNIASSMNDVSDQTNLQQNQLLMAYLMNQYLGMNNQSLTPQQGEVKKPTPKKNKKNVPKSESSSKLIHSNECIKPSSSEGSFTPSHRNDLEVNNMITPENMKDCMFVSQHVEDREIFKPTSNKTGNLENESHNENQSSGTSISISEESRTSISGSADPPTLSNSLEQFQEGSSDPVINTTKENHEAPTKPLPSFKSVQNNTLTTHENEISDEQPPPTPGFNIMDILEESIIPSSGDTTAPPQDDPILSNDAPNVSATTQMNEQIRQNISDNRLHSTNEQQQMNRQVNQIMEPQIGQNTPQNVPVQIQEQQQQQPNQAFTQQLTPQNASQSGVNQMTPQHIGQQLPQEITPQMIHQMNQMGQAANMGHWSGQMDPASMQYWWNATGGGSGNGGAGSMPYWWNGGGGGMPPPIL